MGAAVDEGQTRSGRARHSRALLRWLTLLGITLAVATLGSGGAVLLDARHDAWRQARQSSDNLAIALERDIARNIAIYDLALQSAADAMRLPGIERASDEVRHRAVFGRVAANDYLGVLLVLDPTGNVILASTSPAPDRMNLADRDFFQVPRSDPKIGLYVGPPAPTPPGGDAPTMMISRRVSGPEGQFLGVVCGAVRLAYFQDLFDKLNLGAAGSITLLAGNGDVIAHHPAARDDAAIDVRGASGRLMEADPAGAVVRVSSVDGVRRLYTYRRVGALPLVLVVAISLDRIYAKWDHKAMVIGLTMLGLCAATGILCLLFRREVLRRAMAEDKLIATAATLAELATTDGLTGIANRRAFDAALTREWRRAIRAKDPIGLVMVDVDCFKLFNDRYGHQEGDIALCAVATCIQNSVMRPCDVAARYGGEEFVALLQQTDFEGAMVIADRIRAGVAALAIPHADNPTGRLTVSIGVSVALPKLAEEECLLVRAADAALYEAKRAGRDRVGVADGGVWDMVAA